MAFTEDLTVFYSTDDFAVDAIYSAVGVTHPTNGTTIQVIPDKHYVNVNGMESYRPVARCVESDVSDAADGAQLRIDGSDYYIRDTETNGTGETVLILEAQ